MGLGSMLIVMGLVLVAAGLLVTFAGRLPVRLADCRAIFPSTAKTQLLFPDDHVHCDQRAARW